MSDQINTPTNLPGTEPNVPAAGDGETEEIVSVKDLLNAELGKQFPDDATAMKAVKDTFSYVGKVGKLQPKLDALQQKLGGEANLLKTMDDILNNAGQPAQPATPTPDTSNPNLLTRAEYERERFFDSNPDFKTYRPIIEGLEKATGKPITQVVEDPAFKTFYEKAKAGEEIQKSKSVMQSNPRLGLVTDKFAQANEAAKEGKVVQGANLVTEAVIEAFNLNK